MNRLGDSALDDVRYNYIGSIDSLVGEHTVCSTQYGFDKHLMRYGQFVILREYGNDAIITQVVNIDSLGIGLDKMAGVDSAIGRERDYPALCLCLYLCHIIPYG